MKLWHVGVVLLAVNAVVCTLAIFNAHYRDNFGQCVGLGGIALWCASKAWGVWEIEAISIPTLWMACALACMVAGTWAKVIHFSRLEQQGKSCSPSPG